MTFGLFIRFLMIIVWTLIWHFLSLWKYKSEKKKMSSSHVQKTKLTVNNFLKWLNSNHVPIHRVVFFIVINSEISTFLVEKKETISWFWSLSNGYNVTKCDTIINYNASIKYNKNNEITHGINSVWAVFITLDASRVLHEYVYSSWAGYALINSSIITCALHLSLTYYDDDDFSSISYSHISFIITTDTIRPSIQVQEEV